MRIYSHHNEGVAAILALLLISLFLAIVLTLTAIFTSKIRTAGDARRSVGAVYAAESGIEYCLYVSRKGSIPTPDMANNSTIMTTDCAIFPVKSTGTYEGVTRAFEVSF